MNIRSLAIVASSSVPEAITVKRRSKANVQAERGSVGILACDVTAVHLMPSANHFSASKHRS
jgi:hypothetical protein